VSTWNIFFSYLDEIVSKLTTMIRIKCIGDCYMAAGGFFADSNQPIVHATEAVQFG
jgi:hypothetical protein